MSSASVGKNTLSISAITTSSAAAVGISSSDVFQSSEQALEEEKTENSDFLDSVELLSSKVKIPLKTNKEELNKRIEDLSESILKEDVKDTIKEFLKLIPKDKLTIILSSSETSLGKALTAADWRLSSAFDPNYKGREDVSEEEVLNFWNKFRFGETESSGIDKIEAPESSILSNLTGSYSEQVSSFLTEVLSSISNGKDYFLSPDVAVAPAVPSPYAKPHKVVIKRLPVRKARSRKAAVRVNVPSSRSRRSTAPSAPLAQKQSQTRETKPTLATPSSKAPLIRYSTLPAHNGLRPSLHYFGEKGLETAFRQSLVGLTKWLAEQPAGNSKVLTSNSSNFVVDKEAMSKGITTIISSGDKDLIRGILGLIPKDKLTAVLKSDKTDLKVVLQENWSLESVFDDLKNNKSGSVSDDELNQFLQKFKLPNK